MKYFKNAELARLYNVSEKSVRNWIDAAKQGKVELSLHEQNDKIFIADTTANEIALQAFTERAKKYRNSQAVRKLEPTDSFYTIYNDEQVIDTATNLEVYSEIPQDYRYIGPGAIDWSSYLHRLYGAGRTKGNILTNTIDILDLNSDYICRLIDPYKHVNIVDVGVGNGLAAKSFINTILSTGKLRKYIAVDNSRELLSITRNNIKNWFGEQFTYIECIKDIRYERFRDAITADDYGDSADDTINLVLFLGGTINNFRKPEQALQVISDSMGGQDLLLTTMKLDSEHSRSFFDFSSGKHSSELAYHDLVALEMLNIEPHFYELEQGFDHIAKQRVARIKLTTALSLTFRTKTYRKTVIFEKGDKILLWRIWHYNSDELINFYRNNGLRMVQASTTPDQELILLISKLSRISQ